MRVGVFGATGQVGGVMRKLLEERPFPISEVRFFASARSAGQHLPWGDDQIVVEDTATADFAGLDLAVFSNGKAASLVTAPQGGGRRRHRDRQLLRLADGPGRSARGLRGQPRGCDPPAQGHHRQPKLHDDGGHAGTSSTAPSRRIWYAFKSRRTKRSQDQVASASTSSMAKSRLSVDRASELTYDGHAVDFPAPSKYVKAIAYNVLPQAGSFVEDGTGETDEEQKFRNESRKILHIPDLRVSATCVRVPVFTGHSLAVHAEFAEDLSPDQATDLLARAPGVQLMDVPTPLDAAGQDPSLVGRIRADQAAPAGKGLIMFISSDNLRKGAALNAVQIAELVSSQLVAGGRAGTL